MSAGGNEGFAIVQAAVRPAINGQVARCASAHHFPKSALLAIIFGLTFISPVRANDLFAPHDTFGGVGIIEMPSARMEPDGTLSAGASFFRNNERYNLGFQALPWLETNFRYSGIGHFDSNYPVYWDRSFSIKARLWNETSWSPALAIGVNDLVGTGIYGGEYIVASKQIGNFDLTGGIGWGRLAGTNNFRNPLGAISSSLYNRSTYDPSGGNFNFNDYFHGPRAGVFGGVIWRTPVEGLSLAAEYSSDNYAREAASGALDPKSQLNLGIKYALKSGVALGLDWVYGASIAGTISFDLDPSAPQYSSKITTAPPPLVIRSSQQQQEAIATLAGKQLPRPLPAAQRVKNEDFVDRLLTNTSFEDVELHGRSLILTSVKAPTQNACDQIAEYAAQTGMAIDRINMLSRGATTRSITCGVHQPAGFQSAVFSTQSTKPAFSKKPFQAGTGLEALLKREARQQHLAINALSLGRGIATVYYTNSYYFSEAEAVGRLSRILMAESPHEIEKFRLITVVEGQPQKEFDVLRTPLESAVQFDDVADPTDTTIAVVSPPLQNTPLANASRRAFPRFSWGIYPQVREELFDPGNPLGIQLLVGAAGKLELLPGFSIDAGVEASAYDNFNKSRQNNSTLPHVRSDFLKYFVQGRTGISNFSTAYAFRLTPEIFATLKAGYLESMFAGVGGEVLWRPAGQRWALGADLYEVKQRQYDRLLGLLPYQAVTGHVSLYYASPWHDINFALRAGQYLAGDRGLTLEVSRRFSTGVEIGAFATKTNISSAQFGEGSFDKGIMIRIPLGWAAPIETQSSLNLDLRPIQRDGGQRLQNDTSLYEKTRRTSEAEILLHDADFIKP